MSLSKTTAITHPGALAGLGTLLLALVAVALFFGCREARKPWPPLRDAEGRRIVEKEVGGEKPVSGKCGTRHSVQVVVHSTGAQATETYHLAYDAPLSSLAVAPGTPASPSSSTKSIPFFTPASPPASPTRARTPRSPPRTMSTRGPASTLSYSFPIPETPRGGHFSVRPLSLLGQVRPARRGETAKSEWSVASSAFTGLPTTAYEAAMFGGRMA